MQHIPKGYLSAHTSAQGFDVLMLNSHSCKALSFAETDKRIKVVSNAKCGTMLVRRLFAASLSTLDITQSARLHCLTFVSLFNSETVFIVEEIKHFYWLQ